MGLYAIRGADAAVLGVSAGAINMARRSLDTKEPLSPYSGIGLADITVKPHFTPVDGPLLQQLRQISMGLPICAMEDNSAIFASGGAVSHEGNIHYIYNGEVRPFTDELLSPGI